MIFFINLSNLIGRKCLFLAYSFTAYSWGLGILCKRLEVSCEFCFYHWNAMLARKNAVTSAPKTAPTYISTLIGILSHVFGILNNSYAVFVYCEVFA